MLAAPGAQFSDPKAFMWSPEQEEKIRSIRTIQTGGDGGDS